VAGRYLVLCFFGTAGDPARRRLLDLVEQEERRFDAANAIFCGVSADLDDERLGRVQQRVPGIVWLWDFDGTASRLYGVLTPDGNYKTRTFVLSPGLRVLGSLAYDGDPDAHAKALFAFLDSLPPAAAMGTFAPVLVVPWVFEPEFCRRLIGLYDQAGGRESGFMRDEGGKTVEVQDHGHKRRRDYDITDQAVVRAAQERLVRRLVPEIKKAFQFDATRIERHIVACYDAQSGGHFRAHRDNTTMVTAHRRFAVTINLNAEEYEGSDLWFPEFSPRTYRAPTSGAVVFSC